MIRSALAALIATIGAAGCAAAALPPPGEITKTNKLDPDQRSALESAIVAHDAPPAIAQVVVQRAGMPRAQVAPLALDLSALPRVEVASSSANDVADDFSQAVMTSTREGFRERLLALHLQDAALGMIGVGAKRGWNGGPYRDMSPTASIPCAQKEDAYRYAEPARWMTLKKDAGGLLLTVGDGTFKPSDCKIVKQGRSTVRPALLVADAELYGFRTCARSCAEGEAVVLVFPKTGSLVADGVPLALREIGSFSMVTIPFEKGVGASVYTEIPLYWVVGFREALDIPRERQPPGELVAVAQVGIEIVQGVADQAPIATMFSSIDAPQMGQIDFLSSALSPPPPPLAAPKTGKAIARPAQRERCSCAPGDPLCPCI